MWWVAAAICTQNWHGHKRPCIADNATLLPNLFHRLFLAPLHTTLRLVIASHEIHIWESLGIDTFWSHLRWAHIILSSLYLAIVWCYALFWLLKRLFSRRIHLKALDIFLGTWWGLCSTVAFALARTWVILNYHGRSVHLVNIQIWITLRSRIQLSQLKILIALLSTFSWPTTVCCHTLGILLNNNWSHFLNSLLTGYGILWYVKQLLVFILFMEDDWLIVDRSFLTVFGVEHFSLRIWLLWWDRWRPLRPQPPIFTRNFIQLLWLLFQSRTSWLIYTMCRFPDEILLDERGRQYLTRNLFFFFIGFFLINFLFFDQILHFNLCLMLLIVYGLLVLGFSAGFFLFIT